MPNNRLPWWDWTYEMHMDNVQAVLAPDNTRATYLWANNRLQSHIDGRGNRSTLTYAALDNRGTALQSIRDAMGGRFTVLYDNNDRVQALIDQVGNRSTLTWDGNGNRTALIDANANRTTYLYNANGQITASINQLGFRGSMTYDADGNVAARVNPLGLRTSYLYDASRQIRGVVSPMHSSTARRCRAKICVVRKRRIVPRIQERIRSLIALECLCV